MLKDEIKQIALSEGATKVGIASVERFAGAPAGHAPVDFIPGARSVISVGVRLLDAAVDRDRLFMDSQTIPQELRMPVQEYIYETVAYGMVNTRLERIALSIAFFLEKRGYPSMCFPATYGTNYDALMSKIPNYQAFFSHRHAAVRAGLGEFGLNNLVLTPEYGPRMRFNSIITTMKLEPDSIITEKLCVKDCALCLESCALCVDNPKTAILAPIENLNWNEIWLDPPSITDKNACAGGRCAGECMRVCPVGSKRTHATQGKRKSSR